MAVESQGLAPSFKALRSGPGLVVMGRGSWRNAGHDTAKCLVIAGCFRMVWGQCFLYQYLELNELLL